MKKKRVVLGLGIIFLLLGMYSMSLYNSHQRKVKKEKEENEIYTSSRHTRVSIEDITAMNSGKGEYQKDSFLVLKSESFGRWSIGDIGVVPNQFVVFQKLDYTYKWTEKEPFITLENYKEARVLLYNLADRSLAKIIDNMPWMEDYPDYQLNSASYNILAGKEGDYFLKIDFKTRPQLPYGSEGKPKIKWFSVYHSLLTDEVVMLKDGQKEKEKEFLAEDVTKTVFNSYTSQITNKDFWNDFYHQEGLIRYEASFFDDSSKLKKDKPAYFAVSVESDTAVINLSTNALPNENADLYARFPDLKQYIDQEWRGVKIFLMGKPSKEEIATLFADESRQ